MKRTCLSIALLIGLTASGPAFSQMMDGSAVDGILGFARQYGTATLEAQADGQPRIAGETGGIPYQVFFLNCAAAGVCEDINFYAGFAGVKPTMDAMNAWNRDKRFGRAYLDSDLDAVIEYDINLEHGVSAENLNAAFALWSLLLGEFAGYVGYSPPAN